MKTPIRRVGVDRRNGPRGGAAAQAADSLSATVFDTALGWMAIAWSDTALEGIVFGHNSRRQAEEALRRVHRNAHGAAYNVSADELDEAPPWVPQLVAELRRYAEGARVDFSQVPIAQAHLTPFGRRVVAACRRIGWGRVSSYGELAAKCRAAGAARAVGTVMARNRFPLVVPCHRVLAAGGKLGGYSAPGGLTTKRLLLEMEESHALACKSSGTK